MSSYNKLNGHYAAENKWLLTDVLRGDWGHDGIVMSDWFGSRSTAPTVNAGLDLEMPGPTRDRGDKLLSAVAEGHVSAQTVRARALAMLRLMDRTGALSDHRPHQEQAQDLAATRALIRRAGADGAVLLKNDGLLPLAAPQGRIAVIGPNAQVAQIMGGGSAQLNPHYAISPWAALSNRLGQETVVHAPGCTNHRWEPLLKGRFTVEFFPAGRMDGTPVHVEPMTDLTAFWIPPVAGGALEPTGFSARVTGSFTPQVSGLHRAGLVATGPARLLIDGVTVADARQWTKGRTFFEEGCDEVVGEVTLAAHTPHQVVLEFTARAGDNLQFSGVRVGIGRPLDQADIAEAAALAAACETAVVFVGRSGEWDTEGSDLEGIRLPGCQDELVAAVLKANPRTVVVLQTGGPVEMPWVDAARAILQAWYPGQEAGNAIADMLFGDVEPGGRLPQTFPRRWQDNPTQSQDPEVYPGLAGQVRYAEGVFIGHRHYDAQGLPPLYAFGHGLGYTTWAMSGLTVTPLGQGATVALTLTNTGDRAGSTVAQIYVGAPAGSVRRPLRVLAGFAKVALAPGASQQVTVTLDARAFAFFDVAARAWRVTGGVHPVWAGFSAGDLVAEGAVTLADWSEPVRSGPPS